MSDTIVKPEILAAVMAVSHDTVTRNLAHGKLPSPDFHPHRSNIGWRLSTLRRWNPQVAAKIERGIQHDVFTFLPAA